MNKATLTLTAVLCIASAGLAGTLPTVTIDNLDGANHWVLYEMENAGFTLGSGSTYGDGTGPSLSGGKKAMDFWTTDGTYDNFYAYFTPPAQMDAPRLHATYSNTKWARFNFWYVTESGGWIDAKQNQWPAPGSGWHHFSVDNNPMPTDLDYFRIDHSASGDTVENFDYFILYDGAGNRTSTVVDGWATAPQGDLLYGEVAGNTAEITIDGAESYTILLDGNSYTPGDTISIGQHRLSIESFNADGERHFVGADFTVTVPEPATLGLLGIGGLALLKRRNR